MTNIFSEFCKKIDCRDLDKMKNGMGEKIGIFTYLVSSFVSSVVVSFIYGWELTLVMISTAPLIILATAIIAKVRTIQQDFQ